MVLLQASCPSLPHGAGFATVDAPSNEHEDDGHSLIEDEGEDADSDIDDGDDERHDSSSHGGGLFTTNPAGGFEPLTLKQCCEARLAREVDLHNAGAMLAYAVRQDCCYKTPSLMCVWSGLSHTCEWTHNQVYVVHVGFNDLELHIPFTTLMSRFRCT